MVLILLSAFSVLLKANFLAVAGATMLTISLDLTLRSKHVQGFGLLLLLVCAIVCGWLIAGQQLGNLDIFYGV